ncbi:glucosaminidase domain-containing protein [Cohnella sp. AR92]|uniref:glucosaminidase domain-containing protein n=1 Tax=Cohnella sp. AR92 TaxID=648716 RepID=UPI000F8C43F7|nr:glucosaminidase domain-containing protein [Cohnella sp. AR92]RUS46853.1 hypothetical protein ELR57_10610 [Cohnella sp. AR92]
MNSAVLLSPSDVVVIRRYVQTKYAPLPSARQAEIVADAIRGTIERRLPDLKPEIKAHVTKELIRRCLVSEGRDVIPEDVLEVCSEIRIEEPKDLDRLYDWLEARESGRWTREQIASLVNRGSRKLASLGEEHALTAVAEPLQPEWGSLAPAAPSDKSASLSVPWWHWRRSTLWGALSAALIAGVILWTIPEIYGSNGDTAIEAAPPQSAVAEAARADASGMPVELRYMDFEREPVLAYLHGRDSLLAQEPYFTAIIESAREFDVNPLLLLAITGQEQGFVPRTHKQAKEIANNPFNVFHSWQEYNTDIRDSSRIAAKTIAKRGGSTPEGEDAIEWINRKYAEDMAWSTGVRQLFAKLTELSQARSDQEAVQ